MNFPFYKQSNKIDCGPTCLRMIAEYYGKNYTVEELYNYCEITEVGVSLKGISNAAERIGFQTLSVSITYNQFKKVPLPCIIHWNLAHFVVVFKIKNDIIYISDPAFGQYFINNSKFLKIWTVNNKGVALLLV
jgi:ATP-binding cassette subfamily B protein